jgi:hypothetical protein
MSDKPKSKLEQIRETAEAAREAKRLRNLKPILEPHMVGREFLPARKPHEISNPFEDAARGRDPAPKSYNSPGQDQPPRAHMPTKADCKANPELTGHSRKERRERVPSSGPGESPFSTNAPVKESAIIRGKSRVADGPEANSGAPKQPRGEPVQIKSTQPPGSPKFDRDDYHRKYMKEYMAKRRRRLSEQRKEQEK